MDIYGSDKPDLRYEMLLQNLKSFTDKSEFNAFKSVEVVKGIVVLGGAKYSRKVIDDLFGKQKNPMQTMIGGMAKLSLITRRNLFYDDLLKNLMFSCYVIYLPA